VKEIALVNIPEIGEIGIIPFYGPIRFEFNGEPWYTDGALAIKGKYINVDPDFPIEDALTPKNFIKDYGQYARLELAGFYKAGNIHWVYRGKNKDGNFYVAIQSHFMAKIDALAKDFQLYAKNPLSLVTIEAVVKTEVDHDCDCEFCHEETEQVIKRHLFGAVMPISLSLSKEEIEKIEGAVVPWERA
jgi:hypothetical protein